MPHCLSVLAGLLLMAISLSGCSALNVRQPTAAFRSVDIADVTPEGFTANFQLDVANPNSIDIPLSAADYRLSLAGVPVVDGKTARLPGALPANGSREVKLPVPLRFAQLLSAGNAVEKAARQGGDIPFAFSGGVEFSPGGLPLGGPVRVPLEFSGDLPLRQALRQVLNDPGLLTHPDALRFLKQLFGGAAMPDNPLLDRLLRGLGS